MADGGTAQVRFVSANEVRNTIVVLAGNKDERKVYHLVSETEVVGANGKAVRAGEIKEGTPIVLTRLGGRSQHRHPNRDRACE